MSRRIEFKRNVPWSMFTEAWAATAKPGAKLHMLRVFGVLILW